VRTAVNGGSELLIFVPRAAHSHDSICHMSVVLAECPPASGLVSLGSQARLLAYRGGMEPALRLS
jgi:hypothetical protein